MKVGDYVLVGIDGCEGVGKIECVDFTPKTHLIRLLDGSMPFAVNRHERNLTLIDPAFHNLLTDVHKESNDD